jgi:hypothetical protein
MGEATPDAIKIEAHNSVSRGVNSRLPERLDVEARNSLPTSNTQVAEAGVHVEAGGAIDAEGLEIRFLCA